MKSLAQICIRTGRFVVLLTFAALLSDCARTQPVTFYQLSAIETDQVSAKVRPIGETVLGIGPVRLPEFLDRPQIVIRASTNRVQLIEGHRWAEPLAEGIPRTLRENLAAQLGTERIFYYPWNQKSGVDLQILVEILRFEGEGYAKAHLEAVWSIQGRKGKILLPQRRASYQIASPQPDCEGLVQALSQILSRLGQEIAGEILQNDLMERQ